MQVRAVVGSRVSVYDDQGAQTSPEVQREAGVRYAARHDWDVIGYFEDLDVSASVAPWDRPDLGPWLGSRADEWDAMVFAKVDRAFRSIKDCADVAHWAEKNKKILAFSEDGIVLNFRDEDQGFASMMAKAFLMIASIFAEMELRRIKGRFKDAHAYIRTRDRWSGGQPPFGYRTINHPEGHGKTLTIDPVSAEYVRDMATLVTEGKSLWEVAHLLNSTGVPTPVDYYKGATGAKWVQAQVGRILRSQSCLGLKMTGRGADKKLVRGENGLPVRIADPLFTDEEWNLLQTTLNLRTATRERSKGAAALLGIVYCGSCRGRLYRRATKPQGTTEYVYYRCPPSKEGRGCSGYSFKESDLIEFVDEMTRIELEDIPLTRRVFVPGEDHTKELEQVVRAMTEIRSERDLGMYDYKGGDEEYKVRLTNLVAQRKVLSELPQRSDEWREEETGETFAQAYESKDREERRRLLLAADIRVYCSPFTREYVVPADLRDRATRFIHGIEVA